MSAPARPSAAPTSRPISVRGTHRLSAGWAAGEYLDWVVDLVIAHIRAITTAAR